MTIEYEVPKLDGDSLPAASDFTLSYIYPNQVQYRTWNGNARIGQSGTIKRLYTLDWLRLLSADKDTVDTAVNTGMASFGTWTIPNGDTVYGFVRPTAKYITHGPYIGGYFRYDISIEIEEA